MWSLEDPATDHRGVTDRRNLCQRDGRRLLAGRGRGRGLGRTRCPTGAERGHHTGVGADQQCAVGHGQSEHATVDCGRPQWFAVGSREGADTIRSAGKQHVTGSDQCEIEVAGGGPERLARGEIRGHQFTVGEHERPSAGDDQRIATAVAGDHLERLAGSCRGRCTGLGALECALSGVGSRAVEDPGIQRHHHHRTSATFLQRTQVLAVGAAKDLRSHSALWEDQQLGGGGRRGFQRVSGQFVNEVTGAVETTGPGIDPAQPGLVPGQQGTAEVGGAAVDHDPGAAGSLGDQSTVVEQQVTGPLVDRGWRKLPRQPSGNGIQAVGVSVIGSEVDPAGGDGRGQPYGAVGGEAPQQSSAFQFQATDGVVGGGSKVDPAGCGGDVEDRVVVPHRGQVAVTGIRVPAGRAGPGRQRRLGTSPVPGRGQSTCVEFFGGGTATAVVVEMSRPVGRKQGDRCRKGPHERNQTACHHR